jgi:hypothetical protein
MQTTTPNTESETVQSPTDSPTESGASACSAFVVGMPDTKGYMCWLAGDGAEERYYTPSMARRFPTAVAAEAAMIGSERAYKILRESEMSKYTPPHLQEPNAGGMARELAAQDSDKSNDING